MRKGEKKERKAYSESKLVHILASNGHGKNAIREQPQRHQPRAETLIRIIQRLPLLHLWLHVRRQRPLHGAFKLAVDIRLRLVDLLDHSSFAVVFLLRLGRGQSVGFVRTLCAPRHIVPVAEGVDHQDVDVRGHDQEVGREGGEHVPGVEVHEGGDEIEAEGGGEGDDDDSWSFGTEEGFEEFADTFVCYEGECATAEGADDEVHG